MGKKNTVVLRAETLHLVRNGALGEVIDSAIDEIYKDLTDRPSLSTARKLKIEISFIPSDGEAEYAKIGLSVDPVIPPQKFGREMKVMKTNDQASQRGFAFESDTENARLVNPDQTVIDEIGGNDGE